MPQPRDRGIDSGNISLRLSRVNLLVLRRYPTSAARSSSGVARSGDTPCCGSIWPDLAWFTPGARSRMGPVRPRSAFRSLVRELSSGFTSTSFGLVARCSRGQGIGSVGGCSGVIRSGKTFSLVPFCSISFHFVPFLVVDAGLETGDARFLAFAVNDGGYSL